MLRDIDNWYFQKSEPVKSCLLALRDYILQYDRGITERWKYRMPCYCYNGKMFCYLWIDKKTGQPYILVVEGKSIDHPSLIRGKRSRMKILPIDANNDIPITTIDEIFRMAIRFYI